MFLFRSAFWIVTISFLINGGVLPSVAEDRIPASARQSAAEVMTAVGSLHNYCAGHAQICDFAAGSVAFARDQAEAAITSIAKSWDKSHPEH